jgi:hypothetical protein
MATGATFTDAEDFMGALQEARIELVVTSPGLFWARLNRVVLPHLRLVAVSESLPRIAYLALEPERVCVSLPLRSDLSSVWGGVSLPRGHVVFHSRGERLHQRISGPTDWGLLSVESKHLIAAGRALAAVDLAAPPAGRILKAGSTRHCASSAAPCGCRALCRQATEAHSGPGGRPRYGA